MFKRHLFTEIKPILQYGAIQSPGTKEVCGGQTKKANAEERLANGEHKEIFRKSNKDRQIDIC